MSSRGKGSNYIVKRKNPHHKEHATMHLLAIIIMVIITSHSLTKIILMYLIKYRLNRLSLSFSPYAMKIITDKIKM